MKTTKKEQELSERSKELDKEIATLKAKIQELEAIRSTQNKSFTSYDSIKSYEDACAYLNIDIKKQKELFTLLDTRTIADIKLCTIYKAINQIIGFKANWQDKNQPKWYPYFNLSVSGGVVLDCCYFDSWGSDVGSRLCTANENVAKYIGEQFADLYADWMLE